MPKETRTIRVQPILGEALRYKVESWGSPQRPRTVDLACHGGRGECDCQNWRIVRWQVIKAGCKVGDPKSLCRHVIAARTYFTNHILHDMSEELGNKE